MESLSFFSADIISLYQLFYSSHEIYPYFSNEGWNGFVLFLLYFVWEFVRIFKNHFSQYIYLLVFIKSLFLYWHDLECEWKKLNPDPNGDLNTNHWLGQERIHRREFFIESTDSVIVLSLWHFFFTLLIFNELILRILSELYYDLVVAVFAYPFLGLIIRIRQNSQHWTWLKRNFVRYFRLAYGPLLRHIDI